MALRNKLHRAMSKNNGLWYEGYYVRVDDTTYCVSEDYEAAVKDGRDPRHHLLIFDEPTDWGLPNIHRKVEIDADTLSECTGYKDANGTLIYENDIVEHEEDCIVGVIQFNKRWEIKWQEGCHYRKGLSWWAENEHIEVIGNIFQKETNKD